jgi:acetyl esterase/lipase
MVDFESKGAPWQTNADRDGFVTRELALQSVSVFLPHGIPAKESPLDHDLRGASAAADPGWRPRGHPRRRDRALAAKVKAAGVDVTLEVWPNMAHFWHNFSYLPDEQHSLERIGQVVEERTSGAAHG